MTPQLIEKACLLAAELVVAPNDGRNPKVVEMLEQTRTMPQHKALTEAIMAATEQFMSIRVTEQLKAVCTGEEDPRVLSLALECSFAATMLSCGIYVGFQVAASQSLEDVLDAH